MTTGAKTTNASRPIHFCQARCGRGLTLAPPAPGRALAEAAGEFKAVFLKILLRMFFQRLAETIVFVERPSRRRPGSERGVCAAPAFELARMLKKSQARRLYGSMPRQAHLMSPATGRGSMPRSDARTWKRLNFQVAVQRKLLR